MRANSRRRVAQHGGRSGRHLAISLTCVSFFLVTTTLCPDISGRYRTETMRVVLEAGTHGKRVVAVAPDWPGLERGSNTDSAAIERLLAYVPRYAPVARQAGLHAEFAAAGPVETIERYVGTGSTDFWGISFAFSSIDTQHVSAEELDRELSLMQAAWTVFDHVRSRVSEEMQRGPRGGGRTRDQIARHVIRTEQDWAKKLGLPELQAAWTSKEVLKTHRDAYCAAIRGFHAESKMARTWPLRFLIRHTAYHTLDHR